MSSNELLDWHEYFDIYGFERDIEDSRHAMLIDTIRMSSGVKKSIYKELIPDYTGTKSSEPTITEQQQDWDRFREKYNKVKQEAGL